MFGLDQRQKMLHQPQLSLEANNMKLAEARLRGEVGRGLACNEFNGNRKLLNLKIKIDKSELEIEKIEVILALEQDLEQVNQLNETEMACVVRQLLLGI